MLLGDSSKAFRKLGWEPKITLEELIDDMIEKDNIEAKKEYILSKEINKNNNIFLILKIY